MEENKKTGPSGERVNLFKKQIPGYLVLLIFLGVILITGYIFHYFLYQSWMANRPVNSPAGIPYQACKKYISEDMLPEAEQACKEAVRLNPGYANSYINLGVAYFKQERYELARETYNKALIYVGNDNYNKSVIYYNLGSIYKHLNRLGDSWDYYRKSYEIKKDVLENAGEEWLMLSVKNNDRKNFIKSAINTILTEPAVILKGGDRVEGKIAAITKEVVGVESVLGFIVLSTQEIDHFEFCNRDLGIKMVGPSGWYMYTDKNLERVFPNQGKNPARKWEVAFLKYIHQSVKNNPLIALEIIDTSFLGESMTPKDFAGEALSLMKKVTPDFKLVQSPQEISISNLKGVKYKVEYSLFNLEPDTQLIYVLANDKLLIDIIASYSLPEFAQDTLEIEKCINSFVLIK